MNIVFPIGGKGLRFKNKGFLNEKAFINFYGYPILYWIISNLDIDHKKDKIHFVYNTERYQQVMFDNLMRKYFHEIKYETYPIVKETRGAAETVFNFLDQSKMISDDESFLLMDCDNFYTEPVLSKFRGLKNSALLYSEVESHNNEYSFIILDYKKDLFSIKEKVAISNRICTGVYYFNSVSGFKKAWEFLKKPEDKELYISNIYSVLKGPVKCFKIDFENYHCLGVPENIIKKSINNNFNVPKQRFCFDLDGTLVKFPTKPGLYSESTPIHKNIEFLKKVKDQGHTIIIHTARKMKTANNDSVLAEQLAKEDVIATLEKYNIPYDDLIFGKPYADFYIDDLAINAYKDLEKETGHYYERQVGRSQNKILFEDNVCIKHTNNSGEIFFYKNLPEEIKHLFPEVYDIKDNVIKFEKINGSTVSFLYNNDLLKPELFKNILDSIYHIHYSKTESNNCNIDKSEIYSKKLEQRVESNKEFFESNNLLDEKYYKLLEDLKEYEKSLSCFTTIHGDPVFTNIFINQSGKIKFIDPRGKIGDKEMIQGDEFYDFAKIYQSIIGYDLIVYNKNLYLSDEKVSILNMFKEYIIENYGGEEALKTIIMITKSLLLSLLPLHDTLEHKLKFIQLYKSLG